MAQRDYRHRNSIRLRGRDYARPGIYFVTICTYKKEPIFGEVVGVVMKLNEWGSIVAEEWQRSKEIRREITLDEWVVMPNHFHGIVLIKHLDDGNDSGFSSGCVGATGRSPLHGQQNQIVVPGPRPRSLGSFIGGFKSSVTKTHQHSARISWCASLAEKLL